MLHQTTTQLSHVMTQQNAHLLDAGPETKRCPICVEFLRLILWQIISIILQARQSGLKDVQSEPATTIAAVFLLALQV